VSAPGDHIVEAVQREVARLSALFPPPWVISFRWQTGEFRARRPGLDLHTRTADGLEAELRTWETAPRG
jgi:hypothetical protein